MGDVSHGTALIDRRRMLGVALGVPRVKDAIAFLESGGAGADVVEIRLDYFEEPCDAADLVRRSPRPVIVTNRPRREGGRSELSESERLRVVLNAAGAGASIVDLEWDVATPELIARVRAAGALVIASRHAFDGMPTDLPDWAVDLLATSADVVKVVGMARDATDAKVALDVLTRSVHPTIAIAMGPAGAASRILSLRYASCFLTFAAPPSTAGTAPGQISIDDLRRIYRAERIGPTTAVYGVVGPTIDDESLARLNDELRVRRLDAVAVPFTSGLAVESIVRAYASLPVDGWLLTPPVPVDDLKSVVGSFGAQAQRRGRVSAIARRGSELFADDISQSVERVLEFWLDGLPVIGETSGLTSSRRD